MPYYMKNLQAAADAGPTTLLQSIPLAYDAVIDAGDGDTYGHLREALFREVKKEPVENLPPSLVGMLAEYRACLKARNRAVRSEATAVEALLFDTMHEIFHGPDGYWRDGAVDTQNQEAEK